MRIAEAREKKGWTQEQLARAVGTTQQTIQRWESGQVEPKVSKILAMSKAMGVTVSFLMGVDTPKGEEPQLSAEELELIGSYRLMTESERETVLSMCRALMAAKNQSLDGQFAVNRG